MSATVDFGIDLGTSNSAIAFQEGSKPRLLPASDGSVLLPSAIHVASDGRMTLGAAAAAARASDPANSAIEFKRQMGTNETIAFPASGRSFSSVELSAEILKALALRAESLEGGPLKTAVITVPAMFQLAQCEATRQAAALAGIEHAPLLQEPIAAAMAYSGAGHASDGHWLVYDLGGGTFDVSLVRSRAGRLQVLDHDGDNHLGGKDFNRILARWAADHIRQEGRLGEFRRTDPSLSGAFARLNVEAERVRIKLSEQEQEQFAVAGLAQGADGQPVDVAIMVDRTTLESLVGPTVLRTIELCKALLTRNRLKSSELKGIVLVGGPTRTPHVRALLERELGLGVGHVLDPTTIVAVGAALFAATQKRPAHLRSRSGTNPATIALELEYESMTTNPGPILVGRSADQNISAGLQARVRREDGQFATEPVSLTGRAAFALPLKLKKNELNVFKVEVLRGDEVLACEPSSFSILHGMSLAKPPLSQSVGVMLYDNSVCWYLRKGAVLPARNTITHATTIPLPRGQSGDAIKVPLVQGESERADRNTVIGVLCIHAPKITRDLPAGAEIEVTLTVDEFSRTTARGYVPLLDQWFDEIVMFRMEGKNADQISKGLDAQKDRLKHLEQEAQALESTQGGELDGRVREVEQLIAEGDRDSVELADQMVRLMTRQIDQAEGKARVETLKTNFDKKVKIATEVLVADDHKQELQALTVEFQKAMDQDDLPAAESKFEALSDLVFRRWVQLPDFWKYQLQVLYQRFSDLGMLGVAEKQFQEGAQAMQNDDINGMYRIFTELISLLPRDDRVQFESVISNVTGGGS